jgi:hypothetical protein
MGSERYRVGGGERRGTQGVPVGPSVEGGVGEKPNHEHFKKVFLKEKEGSLKVTRASGTLQMSIKVCTGAIISQATDLSRRHRLAERTRCSETSELTLLKTPFKEL